MALKPATNPHVEAATIELSEEEYDRVSCGDDVTVVVRFP